MGEGRSSGDQVAGRSSACIVALAGRLVDNASSRTARFPVENVTKVKARLRALFERLEIHALVSSAAAGADLLAIEVAARAGVPRRVVLGAKPIDFAAASVAVRPGPWPELFRRWVATPSDGLTVDVLASTAADDYLAVNEAILSRALEKAGAAKVCPIAVLVWEGRSRGSDDTTADFRDRAKSLGFEVLEVSTLG